ncbi:hypothetical protein HWI79_650 [Cryptosporidium felis]|nr:hypothetical protein HWI79_650 [Cryptosporidium felis]
MSKDDDIYSRVRKVKFKNRNTSEYSEGGLKNGMAETFGSNLGNKETLGAEKTDIKKGQGRIITSNITVQGFHTKFMQELKPGDILVIEHPNTLIKENREIVNIISERTLIIDREFSSDLISTSEYYFVESSQAREKSGDCPEKGISGTTYSYREKEGMFKYKTVVKPMKSKLSREEILDIRAKKQRDKYCWI